VVVDTLNVLDEPPFLPKSTLLGVLYEHDGGGGGGAAAAACDTVNVLPAIVSVSGACASRIGGGGEADRFRYQFHRAGT
jgi:hypothetical protein